MGIALFTFDGVLASLQGLVGWLAPRTLSARPVSARPVAARTLVCAARRELRRPLRVVRVVETAGTQASAGRMFISGRMADVCAELDRLAALEATTH